MALDFLCRETRRHLFEIDDDGFAYLQNILNQFYWRIMAN